MSLTQLAQSIKINPKKEIGPDSQAFVSAILRIDEMIGLTEIKEQLTEHLKHAIKQLERGENTNRFHNIIITGGPGRGKTQLATRIGEAFTAMGFFLKANKQPSSDKKSNVSIPIEEYIQIMNSFKKMMASNRDLYKFKRPNLEMKRRRKIGKALANACIHNAIFKGIPFLSVGSRKIIRDITNGKYNRTNDLPPECEMNELIEFIEKEPPTVNEVGQCKVYSKGDLVGQYVGHTAPKTLEKLTECIGGVFILDEAYSLLNVTDKNNDKVCSFGLEALNTMNQFISEHVGEMMIILCGYKELIKALYDVQKGLCRRFNWIYNITDYSEKELTTIFFSKLPPRLQSQEEVLIQKLHSMFEGYKLPNQVGDIENLALITEVKFDNDPDNPTKLKLKHVEIAFEDMIKRQKEQGSETKDDDKYTKHIYM